MDNNIEKSTDSHTEMKELKSTVNLILTQLQVTKTLSEGQITTDVRITFSSNDDEGRDNNSSLWRKCRLLKRGFVV